jgi:hypothetical protein
MQNPSARKGKQTSNTGAKLLITSTALAATLGMWNLFSAKAADDAAAAAKETPDPSSNSSEVSVEFPDLPTLVPLHSSMAVSDPGGAQGVSSNPSGMELRQVSAPPTPTAGAQIQKPVIQRVVISAPSSGGGGGGGGGGKKSGAAKTKSS